MWKTSKHKCYFILEGRTDTVQTSQSILSGLVLQWGGYENPSLWAVEEHIENIVGVFQTGSGVCARDCYSLLKKKLFKTLFCYGVRVTCQLKQQLHRWEDRSWKAGNDGNWRWGAGSVIPTLSMVREPDSSALCTSSSGAYPSGRGAVPPVAAPALSAQGWPRLPPPAGRTLTPTAGRRSCCARSLSKQREIVGYSRGLDVTHSKEGCWLLLFFLTIWTDQFKSIFGETGRKEYQTEQYSVPWRF